MLVQLLSIALVIPGDRRIQTWLPVRESSDSRDSVRYVNRLPATNVDTDASSFPMPGLENIQTQLTLPQTEFFLDRHITTLHLRSTDIDTTEFERELNSLVSYDHVLPFIYIPTDHDHFMISRGEIQIEMGHASISTHPHLIPAFGCV